MFYWADSVQGYTDSREETTWMSSLQKYVSGNFNLAASKVSGADFASGTGGVVNNGHWAATPHENKKRVANFNLIINAFKKAGMTPMMGPGGGSDPIDPVGQCPPKGWTCKWPPQADGYCCSEYGYPGTSPAHCGNGGINSLDSCCKLNNGKITC